MGRSILGALLGAAALGLVAKAATSGSSSDDSSYDKFDPNYDIYGHLLPEEEREIKRAIPWATGDFAELLRDCVKPNGRVDVAAANALKARYEKWM